MSCRARVRISGTGAAASPSEWPLIYPHCEATLNPPHPWGITATDGGAGGEERPHAKSKNLTPPWQPTAQRLNHTLGNTVDATFYNSTPQMASHHDQDTSQHQEVRRPGSTGHINSQGLILKAHYQVFTQTKIRGIHSNQVLTCVTSGSNSLSTVRVLISRLLGSHLSKMGDVALVMVAAEKERERVRERQREQRQKEKDRERERERRSELLSNTGCWPCGLGTSHTIKTLWGRLEGIKANGVMHRGEE